MRIAVDAMGGDHAPHEIVAGAVEAASGLDNVTSVILVGDETAIRRELDKRGGSIPPSIQVHHASETVEMGESPALAIRKKKDNSISRAVDLVKAGKADAMVSAGNTGAVVVASSLKLRTLEGVHRPAIATVMPTMKARPFVLIDAGANVDSGPQLLAQFAVMGAAYSKHILNVDRPIVGLLSIGGEDSKGSDVTKDAFKLIEKSKLNFRGNIEGHDLFLGETDVVVCDGFVGNVVLKTSESAAKAISTRIKQEFTANPLRLFGAMFLRGAVNTMRRTMDPELHGGAPLLGVNGVSIITHGASTWKAIYHAVRVARDSVHHHLNNLIVEGIKENGF